MGRNLKDLANLIEVAGRSGVGELEFDGVVVKFFPQSPMGVLAEQATSFTAPEARSESAQSNPAVVSGASSDPRDPTSVMLSPEDRATMEEIEYEQLMLDNPAAFEQANIDRLMGTGAYAEA